MQGAAEQKAAGLAELTRYRRAADYLAAATIYLQDNVLLEHPLKTEHLKPRLLGHWGTCPGITLAYAGLNRLVRETGQRTLLVTGPGHGAPAIHANLWLEGTHAEYDPGLAADFSGMTELIRRFSWPGGFPSHLSPEVPGVIHEGGELGYAVATAAGAALDNPGLLVACLVGDGEAETGPTATSWHIGKFLDPATSGAVLPVLHLNGYKISSPTVYASMSDDELARYFGACGWSARFVEIHEDGPQADRILAHELNAAHTEIRDTQHAARSGRADSSPRWPMLVLRSPKGMGLPRTDIDGTPLEGTFHAHQVPLDDFEGNPDRLRLLGSWLRSYRPEELFDDSGAPRPDIRSVPPTGALRMGMVAEANGGALREPLPDIDVTPHAVRVQRPGTTMAGATPTLGPWLAELLRATESHRDFRIVSPDELVSNNLDANLSATPDASPRIRRVMRKRSLRMGGLWRCCPNTYVRGGWKATC